MMQYYSWLLIFALSPLALGGLSDTNPDAPDANFIRRSAHSSAILDKTLIIDGGEIAQTVTIDGSSTILYLPMNYTLVADLSQSWDPSNVSWTLINKRGSNAMDDQILWPFQDEKTLYGFGGESSAQWLAQFHNGSYQPLPASMFQFNLTGHLQGNWSTINRPTYQSAAQQQFPQPLNRPTKALGATLRNTGYIVDGVEDNWSQDGIANLNADVPIPGLASFNITNNLWNNDTTPKNVANTFLVGLDNWGPERLLLSSGSSGVAAQSQSLDNITIYDPVNKTWHIQNTTGTAPLVRKQPCAISLLGDNGTYEIFLYAGALNYDDAAALTPAQIDANVALDELWVLSLPAFAWFKVNYTAQHTRYRHTCEKLGNKQMISIGGIDPNDGTGAWSPDPARQGLLFFDLQNLVWDKGYNVSTSTYKTAQVIKDWYGDNLLPNITDPSLAALLNVTSNSSFASHISPNSATPSSGANQNSPHTGAIAGGVVGGLAAVGVCGGLLSYFLRRRYRERKDSGEKMGEESISELGRPHCEGGEEGGEECISELGQPHYEGGPGRSLVMSYDPWSNSGANSIVQELGGGRDGLHVAEMEGSSTAPSSPYPMELSDGEEEKRERQSMIV